MSKSGDWTEETPDHPLTAAEAKEAILKTLEAEEEGVPATVAPPYIDPGPPPGTTNIRVLPGFRTCHVLDLTAQFGVVLTQTAWSNVPQNQVAEIIQIAAENQVLLETQESS